MLNVVSLMMLWCLFGKQKYTAAETGYVAYGECSNLRFQFVSTDFCLETTIFSLSVYIGIWTLIDIFIW